jgi:hypothetical protein
MRLQPTRLVLALALALPAVAGAQALAPVAEPPPASLAGMQQQLQRLETQVNTQEQEIARLRAQVEFLELGLRGRGLSDPQTAIAQQDSAAAPAPAGDPAASTAAQGTPPPATAQQTDPVPQIGQAQEEDEAARREREKALVVQEHAPLFERKFTVDTGFSYSYYDRRQLALSGFLALDAIFLGTINLDQTKASVYTWDVTGRYGLTERINLEANIPWVYRNSRFVSGGAGGASTSLSEVTISDSGIGDASVAGYYQLVKESARWPDIVASLRVRAPTGRDPFGLKLIAPDGDNNNLNVPEALPTGQGVWSATMGLSFLRTYDPVILFGNIGYTYNKSETFDDISPVLGQVQPGKVALGNPFQLSGGMAIALNDRSAISFSISSAMAGKTRTKGADGGAYSPIPGSSSNTSTFNIGATYMLPRSGWTVSGQASMGLTPDAPNFVFSMRASHGF